MSTFRKYPDRVIVDKDGNDVASTASQAFKIEVVTQTGDSAMDDTADATKVLVVGTDGAATAAVLPQREPFIFRVGATALTSGMVASGTRSAAATVTSAGTADQTEWGTEVVYEPYRGGKIDGIATGGVVSGQITIGMVTGASTADGKNTIRIRNKAGTLTTTLALTGAIGCTTAEIFKTYDIPHLFTTANFNAIPFGIAIGNQSNLAGTTVITRIMESSYIMGEFEPGT